MFVLSDCFGGRVTMPNQESIKNSVHTGLAKQAAPAQIIAFHEYQSRVVCCTTSTPEEDASSAGAGRN
jgi:hypothetical protein